MDDDGRRLRLDSRRWEKLSPPHHHKYRDDDRERRRRDRSELRGKIAIGDVGNAADHHVLGIAGHRGAAAGIGRGRQR